jgi:OFA family oxalate/formate antiporter-like MFS transporter
LTQLLLAVVSTASVASLQYGWTLFVNPIEARHHWGFTAIQIAFSLFVLLQTWLAPLEGYLVDRFGPRPLVLAAGTLVGLSWLINSAADTLPLLYLGNALAGIGAGCVYSTCIGQALKWFPASRGLAAGLVAAGFGAGSAITAGPLGQMIHEQGYEHAFAVFGLIQGSLVALMSLGMRAAPENLQAPRHQEQTRRDYDPRQVLRSPVFYLLYVLYVLVASGGLTILASLGPIAQDLAVSSRLQLSGFLLPTVTLALSLNRACDGAGRVFFGWVSDRIGRELTMALAFIIAGCTLLMLENNGPDPLGFIAITTIYFAAYGQIFSLFPATTADTFGARFATANYGMLYTAKGTASLLVALAVAVAGRNGWGPVFFFAMCCNLLAALLAVMVLAPLRTRHFDQAAESGGVVFQVPKRSRAR